MSTTVRVNIDFNDVKDGKFYTDDEGCGCCSGSYRITPEEALKEVREAIAELLVMENRLVKFLEEK